MRGSYIRKATVVALVGLLLAPAAAAWGISYRYDSLNRLISVSYGNGMSIAYSYDAAGNIVGIARSVAGSDLTLPTVTGFTLPATSGNLQVNVAAFTATDNLGVTGYCIAATDSPAGCSWGATVPESFTFPLGTGNGSHTLYAFVKDSAGNISLSRSSSVTLNLPLLTVDIASVNNGSGSVNSTPAGIACVSGSTNGCSVAFNTGTYVSLIPLGINSVFSGWSGACTNSSGNCLVTMDASKSATATFSGNPTKAIIEGSSTAYYSVGSALDAVTAFGQTVRARDVSFVENVIYVKTFPARLAGGYTDTALTTRSPAAFTTIDGSLTIRRGTLQVDRLKVR